MKKNNYLRVFRVLLHILLVILLTILTQVGGLAYLIYLGLKRRNTILAWKRKVMNFGMFLVIYSILSFVILPVLASTIYNRKALPITNTALKPLRMYTYLMNRHYVHEDLYAVLLSETATMQEEFPETTTYYLDASFPLGANFPLLPHWSHNDGRKIDLAFYYTDATTKQNKNGSPSWLGYGVCESPKIGEENMPEFCAEKGYFQYSFLEKIVPQHNKGNYVFDRVRTKYLIEKLTASSKIKKIFIEPHLKKRMKLTSSKIRFHGCHAVRHDDHIHLQL
ncbi:hypothetical protein IMCC3317_10300 [Kordia antarctica]|uniref:Uncharacterized protein n=1 Tax=Kordia antarctica TaxID=1218801 RepID=A0A7L4ZG47_9FLAO|nr:hypothetical protein [Kordia antarctica]QHI35683.1 hypothetical protein IMCC3317_10300 [Kordia antarctica]